MSINGTNGEEKIFREFDNRTLFSPLNTIKYFRSGLFALGPGFLGRINIPLPNVEEKLFIWFTDSSHLQDGLQGKCKNINVQDCVGKIIHNHVLYDLQLC